jgi:hypothetical protein
MRKKKVKTNVSKLVFLILSATILSMSSQLVSATTTTTPLGSETVQTVQLVTDGIKSFLSSFGGGFWFVLILAFCALFIVGIFALVKNVTGG